MTPLLRAEERTQHTKGELRRLRDQGKVPGNVYGGDRSGSTLIAVDEKELMALLRRHPNTVLDLELPGAGAKPVMVAGVQRDPLTRHVLHVDLREIDLTTPVRTHAPLEPVGEAPGEKEGGIVQMLLHELEIECLPADIPEEIPVDISGLGLGDSLTVRDLKVPPGVAVRTDPSLVVVTVLVPRNDDAGPGEPTSGAETDRGGEKAEARS
jgi:large subunit ribosomal protein L25